MSETVDYSVERSIGEIEIRHYPKIILATVKDTSDDLAFSILFRYISGGNRPRSKIAITASVMSQGINEQIAMISPAISDGETFSFVMPRDIAMETIPEPLDDRISITEVPERTLAVVRFNGRVGHRNVQKKLDELIGILKSFGLAAKGAQFLMRYNSPFTPGYLRRNEVGVEIEETPTKLPGSLS